MTELMEVRIKQMLAAAGMNPSLMAFCEDFGLEPCRALFDLVAAQKRIRDLEAKMQTLRMLLAEYRKEHDADSSTPSGECGCRLCVKADSVESARMATQ